MNRAPLTRTLIALIAIATPSCNKNDERNVLPPAKPAPANLKAPTPTKPAVKADIEPTTPAETEVDVDSSPAYEIPTPATDRGVALGFIPRDAVFAMRVDCSEESLAAAMELAIVEAFGAVDTAAYEAKAAELWDELRSEMEENVPGGTGVLDVLGQIRGEVVVGAYGIDPDRGDHAIPFSLAVHAELGDVADPARELLAEIAADPLTDGGLAQVSEHRYAYNDDDGRFDIDAAGDWLTVCVGPPERDDEVSRLRGLAAEESFLASRVLATAPRSAEGDTAWFEMFVNLDPVWPLLTAADRDAAQFLDATRLDRMFGLSMVSSMAGPVFHDFLSLHTDGSDVLSKILRAARLDGSWSRYVPDEYDTNGMVALDLAQALDAVFDCMPEDARSMAEYQLEGMQREIGVDLREQVLENLGPHFLFASRGDLMAAMIDADDFAAALVIQLRDVRTAQRLVDDLFAQAPIGRVPRHGEGVRYHSVSIPAPEVPPWLNPSFGFTRDALVIATSPDVFESVVRASKSQDSGGHEGLARALEVAGDGAFSVSVRSTEQQVLGFWNMFQAGAVAEMAGAPMAELPVPLPSHGEVESFAAALPESIDICRMFDGGVQFEGYSPIGTTWLGAVPVAIVASIAIPNLLAARVGANEAAAIATLRNIHSAQMQAKVSGVIDRDGDGDGEYGSLAELAGAVELPSGEVMSPPVLSRQFANVAGGTVTRSGYHYRIFLPVVGSTFAAEQENGGSPAEVDADRAERNYVIYAWPMEAGVTGNRVFVASQDGDILFTDNGYPRQYYSGFGHPPAFDAACDEAGTPLVVDPANPWREGQDGGFWMPVQ